MMSDQEKLRQMAEDKFDKAVAKVTTRQANIVSHAEEICAVMKNELQDAHNQQAIFEDNELVIEKQEMDQKRRRLADHMKAMLTLKENAIAEVMKHKVASWAKRDQELTDALSDVYTNSLDAATATARGAAVSYGLQLYEAGLYETESESERPEAVRREKEPIAVSEPSEACYERTPTDNRSPTVSVSPSPASPIPVRLTPKARPEPAPKAMPVKKKVSLRPRSESPLPNEPGSASGINDPPAVVAPVIQRAAIIEYPSRTRVTKMSLPDDVNEVSLENLINFYGLETFRVEDNVTPGDYPWYLWEPKHMSQVQERKVELKEAGRAGVNDACPSYTVTCLCDGYAKYTLYVKGWPFNIHFGDIVRCMRMFGQMAQFYCEVFDNGEFSGITFVKYTSREAVVRVLEVLGEGNGHRGFSVNNGRHDVYVTAYKSTKEIVSPGFPLFHRDPDICAGRSNKGVTGSKWITLIESKNRYLNFGEFGQGTLASLDHLWKGTLNIESEIALLCSTIKARYPQMSNTFQWQNAVNDQARRAEMRG